jgi:Transglutaminase-like superfamily
MTSEGPRRTALHRHAPARVGATVAAVSRFVPGASCLTQALAARVVLAREGYDSTLQLGMARIDGRLQAHAWLVCDGLIVVGGAGHDQFAQFDPVGPARTA